MTTHSKTSILGDPSVIIAAAVAGLFLVISLGAWIGVWGGNWATVTGEIRAPVNADHWFGTNAIGQDIFDRSLASTRTAVEIGISVALMSSLVGMLCGALAGYFRGGWLDEFIQWLAGVLDAIPFLLFVASVAWALRYHPLAMHLAMIVSFWTTTARLVRAEIIRLKPLPFVESARALGLSDRVILQRHLLPNTFHIVGVQATIVFVAAIKTEVILSFLGLGITNGVSWGVMIAESIQDVLAGHFNNFLAGSSLLFVMVMAFNHLSDALQDALDPRKDGS